MSLVDDLPSYSYGLLYKLMNKNKNCTKSKDVFYEFLCDWLDREIPFRIYKETKLIKIHIHKHLLSRIIVEFNITYENQYTLEIYYDTQKNVLGEDEEYLMINSPNLHECNTCGISHDIEKGEVTFKPIKKFSVHCLEEYSMFGLYQDICLDWLIKILKSGLELRKEDWMVQSSSSHMVFYCMKNPDCNCLSVEIPHECCYMFMGKMVFRCCYFTTELLTVVDLNNVDEWSEGFKRKKREVNVIVCDETWTHLLKNHVIPFDRTGYYIGKDLKESKEDLPSNLKPHKEEKIKKDDNIHSVFIDTRHLKCRKYIGNVLDLIEDLEFKRDSNNTFVKIFIYAGYVNPRQGLGLSERHINRCWGFTTTGGITAWEILLEHFDEEYRVFFSPDRENTSLHYLLSCSTFQEKRKYINVIFAKIYSVPI